MYGHFDMGLVSKADSIYQVIKILVILFEYADGTFRNHIITATKPKAPSGSDAKTTHSLSANAAQPSPADVPQPANVAQPAPTISPQSTLASPKSSTKSNTELSVNNNQSIGKGGIR